MRQKHTMHLCKSKIDDNEKSSKSFKLKWTVKTIRGQNSRKNVRFETSDLSDERLDATDLQSDDVNRMTNNVADKTCVTDHPKPTMNNKKPKSRGGSGQKRVTIMFFYLTVTYVLSYTPPLIIFILFYTIGDINSSLTKTELITLFFLDKLVLLNHIVNPFIYGFFDPKLKEQLRKLCQRKI